MWEIAVGHPINTDEHHICRRFLSSHSAPADTLLNWTHFISSCFHDYPHNRSRYLDQDDHGSRSDRSDFATGRGRRRGRGGYYTDGRRGDFPQPRELQRGVRDSRYGERFSGEGRAPGRGRGRYQQRDTDYPRRDDRRDGRGANGRQREEFDNGRGRVDPGGSGVWGYDDDEDVIFPRKIGGGARDDDAGREVHAAEVAVEDLGLNDDGSGGSRAGPVDREHFYSIKVCLLCWGAGGRFHFSS